MARLVATIILLTCLIAGSPSGARAQDATPLPDGSWTDSSGLLTVAWDPNDFTGTKIGYDTIKIENDLGQLLLIPGGDPDPASCVATQVFSDSIPSTLVRFEPITLTSVPSLPDVVASDARLLQFQDADPQISWYGCAPLHDARGNLLGSLTIRFTANEPDWDAAVEDFEPVFDALTLAKPDPAWTESLQGNRFIHLTDGWSVSWDADRYGATLAGQETVTGVYLVRGDTGEYGQISSVDGTPDECLETFADYYATYPDVVSFAPATDLKGIASDQDGAAGELWRFTWKSTDKGNPEMTVLIDAVCIPLPGSPERTVQVYFVTTEDLFKSSRKGWQKILNTLQFSGGTGTPVASGV